MIYLEYPTVSLIEYMDTSIDILKLIINLGIPVICYILHLYMYESKVEPILRST